MVGVCRGIAVSSSDYFVDYQFSSDTGSGSESSEVAPK